MKPLLFTIALLVPLLPAVRGTTARRDADALPQGQKVSEVCPTITVSCASSLPRWMPAVFTANVSGGDRNVTPTYSWTVSAGAISSGRGESSIVVDMTDLPTVRMQPLTATVEVGGFAQGCQTKASCTTDVTIIIDNFPADTYGNLRLSDEHARLDNLAIELSNSGDMSGYVVCYGGRRGPTGEAARLCSRAKNYLVTRKKFSPDRIVTIDGGYMESPTVVLRVLPRGSELKPSPTVDPSEVEFVKAKKNLKRVRRRRHPVRRARQT